jgi:hypothetical protein
VEHLSRDYKRETFRESGIQESPLSTINDQRQRRRHTVADLGHQHRHPLVEPRPGALRDRVRVATKIKEATIDTFRQFFAGNILE